MEKDKTKGQKILSEEELEKVIGGVNIESDEKFEEAKEQASSYNYTK